MNDGVEAIYAAQRCALHRNAENWHQRFRRNHAWQMRCATGSGNNHLITVLFSAFGEAEQFVWGAVGGDDFNMMRNVQDFEDFGGELHGSPVAFGPHHDATRAGLLREDMRLKTPVVHYTRLLRPQRIA
ncbi:hypothetical protein [Citrobacter freundii]|uniref:Uncharacterized protein n=1 Tax=Citrobacter freundii TaxID=546 RepID=A0A7G2IM29_CITFR|nr:hypothetical protein [Citrobacter freundii]